MIRKMSKALVAFRGFPRVLFSALVMFFVFAAAAYGTGGAQKTGGKTGGAVQNAPAAQIKRIISFAPSNTEILTGLEMGDRLIAVDAYSKGIPGVPANLPEVDFFYPDTEAIIGLEPDLILVNEINTYGEADNPFRMLGELGIRVVQIPTSNSIEGIYQDIRLIADALDVKDRGDAMIASMKKEVDRIAEAGKKAKEKKSVYFEISSMPSIVTFGRGTYLNEMIEIAGGRNIFGEQDGWFAPNAEEIINRNPAVILVMQYGEDPVAEIKNRPGFAVIDAVKQSRIYAIDGDSASRPSQNILPAFRRIAHAIYPELHEAD